MVRHPPIITIIIIIIIIIRGWSGGAMVLGKLPVPMCPTNLRFQ